ncbi:MAG: hypothetical protein IJ228_03035 [Succinivibrio sp.]|nr:hypothetical protein [Succinivibrio sp.]
MSENLPQVSAQENTLAAASEKISFIIDSAQAQILSTVNTTMVYSYFQIGKIIMPPYLSFSGLMPRPPLQF